MQLIGARICSQNSSHSLPLCVGWECPVPIPNGHSQTPRKRKLACRLEEYQRHYRMVMAKASPPITAASTKPRMAMKYKSACA